MKSNWNTRQTKAAIKALNAKLNSGDCAACAPMEFLRIISHADPRGLTVGPAYIEVTAGGWCLEIDKVYGDATIYGPSWMIEPTKVRHYFGLDLYELQLLRRVSETPYISI